MTRDVQVLLPRELYAEVDRLHRQVYNPGEGKYVSKSQVYTELLRLGLKALA